MASTVIAGALALSATAFTVAPTYRAPASSAVSARMMFGGGGDGEGGEGFMDKIKQAQQMFNPEMMKKYSEVGVKVQQLQVELASTEVEVATKDGGVTVKVSGTQVPLSVTVTDELCSSGVDKASEELTNALISAHTKSGNYAQDKMKSMYEELGLAPGQMGLQG